MGLDDVSGLLLRFRRLVRELIPVPFPYRLYSKGRVLGHKRGKRNTRPNTSLLQIEGVANKEDAQFYLGKVRTGRISYA